MSSRACRYALGVGDHPAVDDVGQAAFQAPHRFHTRLAIGQSALVVGATGCVVTELDNGHHVPHPVDPAASRPRQPMPTTITRRCLQRSCAVPGREPALVGESADITNVASQPGGAGRADPEQFQQCAAGGRDQLTPVRYWRS
jgi:hypothetical protein